MTDSCRYAPRSNPFSTRFVRPGAIAYLFRPVQNADDLVARLARFGWRGQIVGPHGSGKSTLLAALAEPLARAGRVVWHVALHDGARRMPRGWMRPAATIAADLIVVDGYEQLSAWGRLTLKARCRRQGWGLLVTAHHDAGFPMLETTSTSLETVRAIVARLTANEPQPAADDVVGRCFAACGGNVRDTLFALYDRWEAARA